MNTTLEHKNQAPNQRAQQHESQSVKAYPSRTIVHAKLEMTEPGDHDEREADAMAKAIMSGGKISRKISSGASGSSGIAVSQQMESQLSHLQGNGRQMPQGLRNMMESGFGRDFSQVRLHTDGKAADMSSSIHAKAFTHGNDIYFNRGQFAPETSEGQRLVAHELTHVVQGTGKVGRDVIVHRGINRNDDPNNSFLFDFWNNVYDIQFQPGAFLTQQDPNDRLKIQRRLSLDNEFQEIMGSKNMHLIACHGTTDRVLYKGKICREPWQLIKEFKNEGKEIQRHDLVVFTSCAIAGGKSSFAQRFSRHLKKNIVIASEVEVIQGSRESLFQGKFVAFRDGERILHNMDLLSLFTVSNNYALINPTFSVLREIMKEENRMTQKDRNDKNKNPVQELKKSLESFNKLLN